MLDRFCHYLRTALKFHLDQFLLTMATDTQMAGVDDDRIQRPGFGMDIDFLPDWDRGDEEWSRFPHAIADALASAGVTVRERRMLEFVSQITDV